MIRPLFADRADSKKPFPYFVASEAMAASVSLLLLDWLEHGALWKLTETDFYEQYEFSVAEAVLPDEINLLFSAENIAELKAYIESAFGTKLGEKHDITVHKLLRGQRIRIHNDYIPGQETHRVLIQLNRGWKDENGGALIFFNSSDPRDMHRVFRPMHNSCVAFEISPRSLHAVSPIQSGERFTLVYSFYKSENE